MKAIVTISRKDSGFFVELRERGNSLCNATCPGAGLVGLVTDLLDHADWYQERWRDSISETGRSQDEKSEAFHCMEEKKR